MEAEIYVRYRKQKNNYEKRLRSICDFLEALKDYKEIQRKVLMSRNFTYEGIRRYLSASVDVLQEEEIKLRSLAGKTEKSMVRIEDLNPRELFKELKKFSFDYMMSKQSSYYKEVYNRQNNDLAGPKTQNQRDEGERVNKQVSSIFEGRISMRIIEDFWQSSDCCFFH